MCFLEYQSGAALRDPTEREDVINNWGTVRIKRSLTHELEYASQLEGKKCIMLAREFTQLALH